MDYINRNHIMTLTIGETEAHLHMSNGKHVVLYGSKDALLQLGESLSSDSPFIRLSDDLNLNFRETTKH